MRVSADLSDRIRDIAVARGLPESAVFEQALERGLADLWDDRQLRWLTRQYPRLG